MSENKIKEGDYVRLKDSGAICYVVIVKNGWVAYDEMKRIARACPEEDVEPIDSKTAFMTELRDLLRKHDAGINFAVRTTDRTAGVLFHVGEGCIYIPYKMDEMGTSPDVIYQMPTSNYPITADNIMNYEKTNPCE